MHLYGIGFNEFGQLAKNLTGTKEIVQAVTPNPSNVNSNVNDHACELSPVISVNQNRTHSTVAVPTPIEVSLHHPHQRQAGHITCDQLSSIAISWHLVAYRYEDNSVTFSPEVSTDFTTCAKSVALSWNMAYAVTLNGKCVCQQYGDTAKCSVIANDTEDVNFQKVVCGNTHSIAITDAGVPWLIEQIGDQKKSVKRIRLEADCAGDGDGNNLHSISPTVPSTEDDMSRDDNHLVLYSHPIGDHLKVKDVTCGNEHALLLSKIGVVFSIGIGSRGQLGHGDTENQSEPRMLDSLEAVSTVMIASGGWHSMALSDIGDVYVWGWNSSGQLGLPCQNISGHRKQQDKEAIRDADSIQQSYVNLQTAPALLEMPGEENVTAIGCGSRHSVAVTEDGQLLSWGWNDYGQLGHSDTRSRDKPEYVKYFNDLHVQDVYAGYWNTYVRTA